MKTILLLLLLVGATAYFLTREKPGTGPKALAGMSRAQPVIAAIERYRQDRGAYPGAIEDLFPDLAAAIPKEINGHPILYERHGDSFDLTFSYASPLPTHCTFSPGTQKWKCGWLNR